MTLQPGSTTGKQEFSLSLDHDVCVKYLGSDGMNTVCKQVTSPQFAGQLRTYEVGDIISKTTLTSEPIPFVFIIPACMLVGFILTKFCLKKCRRSQNPELQEKLIEEGVVKDQNGVGEDTDGSPKSARPKPKAPQHSPRSIKPKTNPSREITPKKAYSPVPAPSLKARSSDKYQDLVCFKCSVNVPGQMVICRNIDTSTKMFAWVSRDGFTALCPNHARAVGSSNWHSVIAKFDSKIEGA